MSAVHVLHIVKESLVVLESVDEHGQKWLLSFAGPNPPEGMAFDCGDRHGAFRLKAFLTGLGIDAPEAPR